MARAVTNGQKEFTANCASGYVGTVVAAVCTAPSPQAMSAYRLSGCAEVLNCNDENGPNDIVCRCDTSTCHAFQTCDGSAANAADHCTGPYDDATCLPLSAAVTVWDSTLQKCVDCDRASCPTHPGCNLSNGNNVSPPTACACSPSNGNVATVCHPGQLCTPASMSMPCTGPYSDATCAAHATSCGDGTASSLGNCGDDSTWKVSTSATCTDPDGGTDCDLYFEDSTACSTNSDASGSNCVWSAPAAIPKTKWDSTTSSCVADCDTLGTTIASDYDFKNDKLFSNCMCGDTICPENNQMGTHCASEFNYCASPSTTFDCPDQDLQVTEKACRCGGTVCGKSQYCLANANVNRNTEFSVCTNNEVSYCNDENGPNDIVCHCDTSTCHAFQTCDGSAANEADHCTGPYDDASCSAQAQTDSYWNDVTKTCMQCFSDDHCDPNGEHPTCSSQSNTCVVSNTMNVDI